MGPESRYVLKICGLDWYDPVLTLAWISYNRDSAEAKLWQVKPVAMRVL
jgi:hypothetical protein